MSLGGQRCLTKKEFHKIINYTTELGIYNTYTESFARTNHI